MIQQLVLKDYDRVAPLFRPLGRHPIVQGVLEGNHPGMVFVDGSARPRVALLWAVSDMLFLAGANVDHFNQALPALFETTISRRAREVGQGFFQMRPDPVAAWAAIVPQVLGRPDAFVSYRWDFSFDVDAYRKLSPPAGLPAGYEIRAIDAAVLSAWPDMAQRILATWPDHASFLQRGSGYCATLQGEFVGSCIILYEGARACEISINTDSGSRNLGVATRLCRATIDACLRQDLLPCWGTESFRLPSRALAQKLAFHPVRDYPTFCFPLDGAADLAALGAYFHSESRRNAETPAREDDLSAARGWSLAGDTRHAARFAGQAIESGALQPSELLASPDFERLRNAPEWSALRERL